MNNDAQYRRRLVAERAALLDNATRPVVTEHGDVNEEDWAAFSHQRFISETLETLDYHKLRLIDVALQRLDAGDYGMCVDCEEPISPKRLNAIPWAARCIKCQELFAGVERFREEATPA